MTAEELLQQILDKQTMIVDNQTFEIQAIILFANLLFGLLLGYFAVKGMTKPWT